MQKGQLLEEKNSSFHSVLHETVNTKTKLYKTLKYSRLQTLHLTFSLRSRYLHLMLKKAGSE